jgi:hypothetical protein
MMAETVIDLTMNAKEQGFFSNVPDSPLSHFSDPSTLTSTLTSTRTMLLQSTQGTDLGGGSKGYYYFTKFYSAID